MNEFNMLVLNIAVIVFIITLVIVGIILYFSIKNAEFPPYTTTCPTYYKIDGSYCTFDNDTYNSLNYPVIDYPSNSSCYRVPFTYFYQNGLTDDEIICLKNRWAKKCDVFWDGISNNSSACLKSKNSLFPNSVNNYLFPSTFTSTSSNSSINKYYTS